MSTKTVSKVPSKSRSSHVVGRVLGYARVSTTAQDLKLQIAELLRAGCAQMFEDKRSGATAERVGLDKLRAAVQPGDQVVVYKLDRIARSLRDLLNILDEFAERGVGFRSLHDPIVINGHNDDPTAKAMAEAQLQMLGVFAQLERAFIIGRTAAGRQFAMAEDDRMKRPSRFGRKPKLTTKQLEQARKLTGEDMSSASIAAAAEIVGVHRTTLYRYLTQTKRTR